MMSNRTYKLKMPSAKNAARGFLVFCAVIAIFAPLIANHLPLYVSYRGATLYPAFDSNNFEEISVDRHTLRLEYENVQWDTLQDATILYAPIPYSPSRSDFSDAGFTSPIGTQQKHINGSASILPPGQRHWLGTGKRGDDVLASLIHGARVSLSVALFSMLIAGMLGITLGTAAGYFGDSGIRISRGAMAFAILFLLPAFFYGHAISEALINSNTLWPLKLLLTMVFTSGILVLSAKAGHVFTKGVPVLKKDSFVPVDAIIIKLIELISSLPTLLLILAFAAITTPTISNLIWIIGLTSWTEIARLTRAEVLKIREMDYISSAKSMGVPVNRIMISHILPNALTPVFTAIAFGAGGAILAESGLSFLGIGVPPETATWGKLIAEGRQNFDAWWMVLFPGLMISMTVMAFYVLGKRR